MGKLSSFHNKRNGLRKGSVCCIGVISGLCLHEFGAGLLVKMLPTVEESRGYDFQDPENAEKWRGLFVNSLRKVCVQYVIFATDYFPKFFGCPSQICE